MNENKLPFEVFGNYEYNDISVQEIEPEDISDALKKLEAKFQYQRSLIEQCETLRTRTKSVIRYIRKLQKTIKDKKKSKELETHYLSVMREISNELKKCIQDLNNSCNDQSSSNRDFVQRVQKYGQRNTRFHVVLLSDEQIQDFEDLIHYCEDILMVWDRQTKIH